MTFSILSKIPFFLIDEPISKEVKEVAKAVSNFWNDRVLWETLQNIGIKLVLIVLMWILAHRFIRKLMSVLQKTLSRLIKDEGIVHFSISFVRVAIYILLFIVTASWLGFPTTSMITILGSAGLALGLALQGSLSNVAGGLLILLMKPFKVGDYIYVYADGNEGTVTEINIVYTKLLTIENKVIIMPNGSLSNSNLINYSYNPYRRIILQVGISYNSDIDEARSVLLARLKSLEFLEQEMEMEVFVDKLADSSVVLGISCWVSSAIFLKSKRIVLEETKKALDEANIEIPFPQLRLHFPEYIDKIK